MLTDLEIARFLGHAEGSVRDHALRSLAGAGHHAATNAELAIAVLQKAGVKAFTQPTLIAQLNHTPKSAEFALASRSSTADAVLLALPQSLLLRLADQVAKLPAGTVRTRLEARLALSRQTPEAVWNAAASNSDAVLVLCEHEAWVSDRVMDVLRTPGDAMEAVVIELAGRLRLASTLPQLMNRLASATPKTVDAAALALGRIGTAGAATLIEERCNLGSATPAFRLAAARALSGFRIPSAEAVMLRLLAEEEAPAVAKQLCVALAELCTTSGYSRLIAAAGQFPDASLASAVQALGIMLKEKEVRPAAAPAKQASSPSAPSPFSLGTDPIPADDEPISGSAPAPSAPAAKVAQIRREDAKVGRNDPCPCGSGKKYKKCCGA